MKTNIALLICGGTLDKDYAPISGELTFSQTHLPEILNQANSLLAIRQQVVMLKDSLEMDAADRDMLHQACINSSEQKIVITHGTDTMTLSAQRLLQDMTQLANKTIVFTGAMRPFRLGDSDASFNLGCALMAAQTAPAGVWITMHGQLFNANAVHKNRAIGQFETL